MAAEIKETISSELRSETERKSLFLMPVLLNHKVYHEKHSFNRLYDVFEGGNGIIESGGMKLHA